MPEIFKIYLDQMLRLDVALALRGEGYDVMRASEVGQSRSDDYEILQKAIIENRILITLDEHFGDWVILPLSKHPGVIRLKVNPATSKNIIKLRGNFKSPPLVIPNEVRNLKGIDIKRFLPLVEMTIDAFLSFEITSFFYHFYPSMLQRNLKIILSYSL